MSTLARIASAPFTPARLLMDRLAIGRGELNDDLATTQRVGSITGQTMASMEEVASPSEELATLAHANPGTAA